MSERWHSTISEFLLGFKVAVKLTDNHSLSNREIPIHHSLLQRNKETDFPLNPDGVNPLKLNDSFLLDFEVPVLISFILPPAI